MLTRVRYLVCRLFGHRLRLQKLVDEDGLRWPGEGLAYCTRCGRCLEELTVDDIAN